MSGLPEPIASRLSLSLIVAPMLYVSGVELVTAVCRADVIGAFPAANPGSAVELDRWLSEIEKAAAAAEHPAPHCPNLIVRDPRLAEHLEVVVAHRVEIVIASVGSPAPVVEPLHDVGALVFADVATLEHARKAVRDRRRRTRPAHRRRGRADRLDEPLRLHPGGPLLLRRSDRSGRRDQRRARPPRRPRPRRRPRLHMGTRFIASRESMGEDAYKTMLVESSLDDIVLTPAFTGLPANMLVPSIRAAGLDPEALDESVTPAGAAELYGARSTGAGPCRWTDIFSAGHSVSGVDRIEAAADIVERTRAEYLDG